MSEIEKVANYCGMSPASGEVCRFDLDYVAEVMG